MTADYNSENRESVESRLQSSDTFVKETDRS